MKARWHSFLRLGCIAVLIAGFNAPTQAARYLEADAISPSLLTPPPAEQSEAWQHDIEVIAELQHHVDPAEIAAAQAEMHMAPEMVASVLGPHMTRAAYPNLYALLDRVGEEGKDVNHAIKDYWHTRRPYIASPRVKALIDAHSNPAYPSGHTSGSLVWAEILGQLFPEQQAQLRTRAEEIAQHRVLAGMHYPADIEGGRRLGLLILGALWQSPAFQQDFAAAREEIAAKEIR